MMPRRLAKIAAVCLFGLALWPPGAGAVRVTTVLEEIDKAWKEVSDFSAVLLQEQTLSFSEEPRCFVGYARLARPEAMRVDSREISRREYDDCLTSLDTTPLVAGASDETVWYDGQRGSYWDRYKPADGVVYREATPTSPIYFLLGAVSGLSSEKAKDLENTHNIDAPLDEEMLGQACYKLRLEPKMGHPAEYKYIDFWVDRKYYLPVKAVMKQQRAEIETYVLHPRLNRGLDAKSIELRVPRGTVRRDRY